MAERIRPQLNRNVILLIGSNINPLINIEKATTEVSKLFPISGKSSLWETEAIGTTGANFFNIAISVSTSLSTHDIKFLFIRDIEKRLGRLRTDDKYAPRTIDIDIILDGATVIEPNLWNLAYIAVPVAELYPQLLQTSSGILLVDVAKELKKNSWIRILPAADKQ